MRVLMITNMWPSDDHALAYRGIFVQRQVEGVRNLGVSVDVDVVFGYRTRWEYLRAACRVLALNLQPMRYDVIHGHTGHCGLLACLQLRSPVVFSYVGYDLDGPAEDHENWRTRLERLLFRWMSGIVAGTIAKSARGRRALPRCGLARNQVVPNGVDRELFRPMPRADARAALGWDHHDPVALFAADPARGVKRFELAEAAVEHARQRNPGLRLEIAASVPAEKMPLLMNACDVLLMTSVAEGSPNIVKEAASCNLPVVSVDVGDVRDIVGGSRHCHIVDADPAALGDAVVEVVNALPERSDARERTTHIGLEYISAILVELYRTAMTRGPGPFGFVRAPRRAS